jgi:hypothetical protein
MLLTGCLYIIQHFATQRNSESYYIGVDSLKAYLVAFFHSFHKMWISLPQLYWHAE